jgi:hypothetical protein
MFAAGMHLTEGQVLHDELTVIKGKSQKCRIEAQMPALASKRRQFKTIKNIKKRKAHLCGAT